MHITRIFTDVPLTINEVLELPEAAAHHIGTVLRMRPDQKVHVFNGRGGYFTASIAGVGKHTVSIVPLEFFQEERESNLNITLGQGISRGQHMDFTVQKAVELGVKKIVPLLSEFSNVRLDRERSEKRLAHWRAIIIHACEQSGRNRLPEIISPISLREWTAGTGSGRKMILAPLAGNTLKKMDSLERDIEILSGPEGGFSEDELKLAVRAGYEVVTLGPRVLRTETAAVAALTAIQVLWGDLG